MANIDKLLAAMRETPANVRFADLVTVATAFFGKPRQSGGSHVIWKMPWAGDPRVNAQEGKNGKAKAYQVEQLLAAIDRVQAEQAEKQKKEEG